jgi:hypothetical protein
MSYWDTFDRPFEFDDPNATTRYARHCLQIATEFRQRVLDWVDPQIRRRGNAPWLFAALQASFLTFAALDLIRLRAGRQSLLPPCERTFTQARRQGTVTSWKGRTFANAHLAAAEMAHVMYLLVRESAPLTTDDLRRLCAGFTVVPYAHEDTRSLSDRLVAARDKLRDVSIQLPEVPDLYAEIEWESVQAAATIETPPAPIDPTVIIALGERQYRIGDFPPLSVEENEDSVLQTFLERPSMDGPTLIDKAGFDSAPRVLRTLRKKYQGRFAHAITLPGKKGEGGYHVAIRGNPSQ